jgi:amidohydrolase
MRIDIRRCIATWAMAIACPGLVSSAEINFDELEAIYRKLHSAPELSHYEVKTAAMLAGQLRKTGFEVIEGLGAFEKPEWKGHGVAAVLRNGTGPVVLIRAELDALPVTELTALPFASKVRAKNDEGIEVGVSHACGHDLHLTALIGLARTLAANKESWRGTVVLIGEPAEESLDGPRALLAAGLYDRVPRPDYILALHGIGDLEVGKIGIVVGPAMQTSQVVNLTVRGLGGHGSRPHEARDPVVLAAQIVVGLQTIVSRENAPGDTSVITVGAINGGTKAAVIPEEVLLRISVRAPTDEGRRRNIDAIARIAKGLASAAAIPEDRMPIVSPSKTEVASVVLNDPTLAERVRATLVGSLGADAVAMLRQRPGADTLAGYVPVGEAVPTLFLFLGVADPLKVADSRRTGTPLPATHSPRYAPVVEPALRTGIAAMTAAVREILPR